MGEAFLYAVVAVALVLIAFEYTARRFRKKSDRLRGPRRSEKSIAVIEGVYHTNMSIIMGVILALLFSQIYAWASDPRSQPLNIATVGLSAMVAFTIMLTTYFEYYYFLITIKQTNHLHDSLSSLVLGAIQAFAILFLPRTTSGIGPKLFWLTESSYAALAIPLLLNSLHYTELREQSDHAVAHISLSLRLSVVFCFTFVALLLAQLGSYFVPLSPERVGIARTATTVLIILLLLGMIAKSHYFLAKWDYEPDEEAPTSPDKADGNRGTE